jgi:hypothetical protein
MILFNRYGSEKVIIVMLLSFVSVRSDATCNEKWSESVCAIFNFRLSNNNQSKISLQNVRSVINLFVMIVTEMYINLSHNQNGYYM